MYAFGGIETRDAEIGKCGLKFLKMVALKGPQNRKVVELKNTNLFLFDNSAALSTAKSY